ncbi:hypothetical protein P1J78_20705 [Psychromarinibacter sp. C21-152]|uniref:Uncharacterized protein n=1 Tax=Psychromarinibacter sediminicola TaxID=3033385 RepID=A0AAE3T9Z7_9RHOB|nr:hypothetical protein [Psychromarinibacter sediminicola]MDF0603170.1 hypothetical protein [Psychromarinibacter sediminicola]
MKTPEWIKPGIYGAIVGAAFIGIVGFTWGGWVTGGTARDRATTMSHDDVVAALVPVCLESAQNDPDRAEKIAAIRDASSYRRRDELMKTGWATVPGAEEPDRDIARACLASLDVDSMPEQLDPEVDEG